MNSFPKMKPEIWAKYDEISEHLTKLSKEVCAQNECSNDNHNCESYAYFDYDKGTDSFSLCDVCVPDYANRSYDCALPLPFTGYAEDLQDQLEHWAEWDLIEEKGKL